MYKGHAIQLHPNWLNACNLRFASNVGLSYNVQPVALKSSSKSHQMILSNSLLPSEEVTCHVTNGDL